MKKEGNSSLLRIFFLVLAVGGGLWLLGELAAAGILACWSVSEAASIGIIGGADGPTAVFVTSSGSFFTRHSRMALAGMCLLAGVLGNRKMKKAK